MTTSSDPDERLSSLRSELRTRRPKPVALPAQHRPVARVAVDLPLAHLDRLFDYVVPALMDEQAVPGCRVKVRFAGREVGGFLVERAADTQHVGSLASLRRVVSAEPVLSPAVLALARITADRYAGTLADVLRLAVPPRHARVEAEPAMPRLPRRPVPLHSATSLWSAESGGEALVTRLAQGDAPRAVWTATPGEHWLMQVAAAAAATLSSGRGTLVCVPDARDVGRLDAAMAAQLGPGAHVVLTADLGPAARYRAFLALSRGEVQIALGTRSAAFAPVRDLGLVAIWDDGDDLYSEPRSPYPHTREVLLLRAHLEGCAALVGGWSRSVEAQRLVASGWAATLSSARGDVRQRTPQVHVTGESDTPRDPDSGPRVRLPGRVFEVVREALVAGPVLVHVPRAGYQPSLSCDRCRVVARCPLCSGPLGRSRRGGQATCRLCGLGAEPWVCAHCGGDTLRFPVVGSLRTAEEWGRSFPKTSVVSSGGDHVVDMVSDAPAIVVATVGAEPRAASGYAAAILLDTWLTMSRPELRAGEEALRRWLNVASLVRPRADGGRVVAVGDPALGPLQALVRWDPEGFAVRELAGRSSAHLPPASRLATVSGTPALVNDALAALALPSYVDVLGPAETGDGQVRLVLRTDQERGRGLTKALQRLQAARSSRKQPPVSVHVDPVDFA